nr:uncharacterized protein LOC113724037 [Coffea arabica]
MASTLRLLAVILLLFTITNTTVTAVEDDELESMLNVLRARGYNLFSNAIATSDLIYEVLAGKSFTLFAPTDSSLFTLDMTNMASDYISILRCHVIPLRMTFSDICRFTSGSSLPTLTAARRATVRVESRSSPTSSDDAVTIDGVGVLLPGLFYSRSLAVHGLRGILNCASNQELKTAPSPVNNDRQAHPPPSNFSSPIDWGSSIDADDTEAPSLSPSNLPDDDRFNSPLINDSQEKHLPSHFFDHVLSPSSGYVDEDSITSTEPEPAVSHGFSPADSPAEQVKFPAEVSPAYDLWLEVPTSPHFAPSSEPLPPPEFSENDDPMAFPPSTGDAIENLGSHMVATDSELGSLNENELSLIEKDGRRSPVSDNFPVNSPEDMAESIKSQPSDEAAFDCPVTNGYDHVSFSPGYVYTRNPMSCS